MSLLPKSRFARRLLRALTCAVWTCAPLAAPSFANVIVLNGGAGMSLQLAVSTAAEGDTILVHGPASFSGTHVDGKSITILGEPSGSVEVGYLWVTNVGTTQSVVVSGLAARPNSSSGGIAIVNCLGSVRIEHTRVLGGNSEGGALQVVNSANVAVIRCSIFGQSGSVAWPTPAFRCRNQSRVALFDSVLQGGKGRDLSLGNFLFPPNMGRDGAIVDATSALFVSGCKITGGVGGAGDPAFCGGISCVPALPGSMGGDGLEVQPGGTVILVGASPAGGAGGIGGTGLAMCCPSGLPVPPAQNGLPGASIVGPATVLPVSPLRLFAPTQARVNQGLAVTVSGEPGAEAFLALSSGAQWSFVPGSWGVFVVGPTVRRRQLGTLPASGVLQTNLSFPELAGLTQALLIQLQVVTVSSTNGVQVGTGQSVCMLGPSF